MKREQCGYCKVISLQLNKLIKKNKHPGFTNRSSLGGASHVALVVKNPTANVGGIRDMGSISGSARSPRGGNGYPLQYSCLENPMDRGAWRAMVHKVSKSWK